MSLPTHSETFDRFLLHLLHRSGVPRSQNVDVVYAAWADTATTGDTFLDFLIAQGVVDRIGAKAITLAWMGQLDERDVRAHLDPAAVAKLDHRIRSEPAVIPCEYRPIGSWIGRYPIKGLLGRGGFGPVYLSVHPTLRIPVAIKPVPARYRDALRAEARRQAEVNHPHVIRVWDYEDGDDPFLVLEYVPGENLGVKISAHPLDRGEGFTLLIHLAAALRAAHRVGIEHHDVKPTNVLTTLENGFKLGDFGLARGRRKFVRTHDANSSNTPHVSGTWNYAAPEVFENNGDHRSDVYALGMTVYHALAGRPAIGAGDFSELMMRHKRGDWEPLHRAAPGVGWAVSELVARMTAADPERRFDSYEELIRAAESAFGLRLDSY